MRLRDRIRRWFKPEPQIQLVTADWFTDEHPIVAQDVEAWHWEPHFDHEHPIGPEPATPHLEHEEPIGPAPVTVDWLLHAFEADPLGAALPVAPAKDNAFYADLLQEQPLSEPVKADLESKTGYWTADFMKELIERGKR